jgi:hypothetical protein
MAYRHKREKRCGQRNGRRDGQRDGVAAQPRTFGMGFGGGACNFSGLSASDDDDNDGNENYAGEDEDAAEVDAEAAVNATSGRFLRALCR